MNAVPMRRIDAPRRRPAGSRHARTERFGRFDRRSRRRVPLRRRDGYTAASEASEAAAELGSEPHLHVVPRRRLAANLAALAIVVVGVLMLAAVVLHTRLAERQRQIDRMEQEVTAEQDRFDVLREQRAVLRAPTRLATASSTLGMSASPDSDFLAVDPWTVAQVVAATGGVDSLDGPADDPLDQVRRVRAAER